MKPRQVTVLCYHAVQPNTVSPWVVDETTFREQLNLLKRRGRIVGLPELLEADSRGEEPLFALTFDDGRLLSLDARRALDEFGIRAGFFVCPAFLAGHVPAPEDYSPFMNWREIRELKSAGHVIGSHSMTHRSFLELTPDERSVELRESKVRIETETGACDFFAAPFGHMGLDAVRQASEAGYHRVFTVTGRYNTFPLVTPAITRLAIHGRDKETEFREKLNGLDMQTRLFRVGIWPASRGCRPDRRRLFRRLAACDLLLCREEASGELAPVPAGHILCDAALLAELLRVFSAQGAAAALALVPGKVPAADGCEVQFEIPS
jgi:peptidoglycan/xylan/chitin deacetylase (PgdA/CDA1 family)